MDSIKYYGKIKEQLEMENRARRNFHRMWPQSEARKLCHQIYNQDELNRQVMQQLKLKDLSPFKYTGEGDSYFVSPAMYKSLMEHCRCGRSRSGLHLLKCLQNPIDKSPDAEDNGEVEKRPKLPQTSNGVIGWLVNDPIYRKWENSTKYISSWHTMPGHRIDAKPYNVIMIG